MKFCTICKIEKDLDLYTKSQLKRNCSRCKECIELYNSQYKKNNKDKIKLIENKYREKNRSILNNIAKEYRNNNKQVIKICKEIYRKKNIDRIKEKEKKYHQNNKEHRNNCAKEFYQKNKYKKEIKFIIKKNISYKKIIKFDKNSLRKLLKYSIICARQKRATNPIYKLKKNVSRAIGIFFKLNGCSKQKCKTLNFVPWTLDKLKTHIEYHFSLPGNEWMSWNNRGSYKLSEWDDNDPATWKWQLDHIIPHSHFKYNSMDCEEFRKCWSLDNLRPYSAKQNLLDGNRR